MNPDPAIMSIFNFGVLVYIVVFLKREIRSLHTQNAAAAAEWARIAKGSETRAENAAREITATNRKIEEVAAEMVLQVGVFAEPRTSAAAEAEALQVIRRARAVALSILEEARLLAESHLVAADSVRRENTEAIDHNTAAVAENTKAVEAGVTP